MHIFPIYCYGFYSDYIIHNLIQKGADDLTSAPLITSNACRFNIDLILNFSNVFEWKWNDLSWCFDSH